MAANGATNRAVVRFDDELRVRITANIAAHSPRRVVLDGRRHAAVAVMVVDSHVGDQPIEPAGRTAEDREERRPFDERMDGLSGGAAFVISRRSSRLRGHTGQWALPGGRVDAGETVEIAALREICEELGVELDPADIIGRLDDYPTRSGYVISPVVVWAGGDVAFEPNPAEVVAAYRVSLGELLRDDSPRFITIPESPRPVVQVPLGRGFVHAPTGAVLVQFRWLGLEGRDDPVDEFEQPVFAWR